MAQNKNKVILSWLLSSLMKKEWKTVIIVGGKPLAGSESSPELPRPEAGKSENFRNLIESELQGNFDHFVSAVGGPFFFSFHTYIYFM
jgi:hypothetical protein